MNEKNKPTTAFDESTCERFEAAWRSGESPSIDEFVLPESSKQHLPTLEELIKIDLDYRWRNTRPPADGETTLDLAERDGRRVEQYLDDFPQLQPPAMLLRLLREEFLVRCLWGAQPELDEYRLRFPDLEIPDWRVDQSLAETGMDETRRFFQRATEDEVTPATGGELHEKELGNYVLLSELGRGGMGVVYKARQKNADRIVALKAIRRDLIRTRGNESRSAALDRFQHEVQATARLEHENIVSIFEVGDFEGEPFYSMRFVDGASLADILLEGPLEHRRAASYMEQVARAVSAAHAQGIFHRDLKPQNILVDGKNDRPLVADFGLAKLQESVDDLTHSGDVIGSPPYMSPEQATDASRVGAASDVYGLGATFYHLLTGRPPFQATSMAEVIQQVINTEPVPPRRLNPAVDRDLETICLKCLEKTRSRRYGSAADLADEIGRYLDHKPIQARPIGPLGRAWRWSLRNPVTAASLTLALAFLIIALIGTTMGYLRASAALTTANEARRESDESFRLARSAVDRLLTHVADDELLNQPGMQPLRRQLLEEAAAYYQQFLAQRRDDPTVRDELAAAHFRVGRIRELMGDYSAAHGSFRSAQAMQEKLQRERPEDIARLAALGDTMNALGRVLCEQQDLDAALAAYRRSRELRQELVDLAPNDAYYRRTLANTYMNEGLIEMEQGAAALDAAFHDEAVGLPADATAKQLDSIDSARKAMAKAQGIRRELAEANRGDLDMRRDLGQGCFNLANLEMVAGEVAEIGGDEKAAKACYDRAEEHLDSAIEIFEQLLADDAENLENRYRLAVCRARLADFRVALYMVENPWRLYDQPLAELKTLVAANRGVEKYRGDLAGVYINRSALYLAPDQAEKAIDELQTARDLLSDPPVVAPRYRTDLLLALNVLRDRLLEQVETDPDNQQWVRDLEEVEQQIEELNTGRD